MTQPTDPKTPASLRYSGVLVETDDADLAKLLQELVRAQNEDSAAGEAKPAYEVRAELNRQFPNFAHIASEAIGAIARSAKPVDKLVVKGGTLVAMFTFVTSGRELRSIEYRLQKVPSK
jgi:hypothetical protein